MVLPNPLSLVLGLWVGKHKCVHCGYTRLPRDALRKSAVTYRHTAHQLKRARICYRFHPFFDHEVEVIRSLRLREKPCVIVQMRDGLRIAVPCWMLDQNTCDAIDLNDGPRLDIDALRLLRELIDLQVSSWQDNGDNSGAVDTKGDRHGPQTTDRLAASEEI